MSILNTGILIMNLVDYPMSFLLLSTLNLLGRSSRGDRSELVLLFGFCFGTPTTRGSGGGLQDFSVSPRPLGSLNLVGVGPRVFWD